MKSLLLMARHKGLLTALVALPLAGVLAAPASAQSQLIVDGTLQLEFARNSDTEINTKRAEGSFAGLIWNDFGAQFDFGVGKHEAYTSTAPSAGVHLYYQPEQGTAVGLFLAAEDRRPGNSYFSGVEAAYRTDRFGIEGYAAYRTDISEATDGWRAGFDFDYTLAALPRLSLTTGAVYDDGDPLERSYGYVGANYEVHDGIQLGGTIGRTDQDATIVAINATFTFGNGAPFNRRDSFGLYPGY